MSDIAAGETPNSASVVLHGDNSDSLAIVETGNDLMILKLISKIVLTMPCIIINITLAMFYILHKTAALYNGENIQSMSIETNLPISVIAYAKLDRGAKLSISLKSKNENKINNLPDLFSGQLYVEQVTQ